jgi:hypothetical protein
MLSSLIIIKATVVKILPINKNIIIITFNFSTIQYYYFLILNYSIEFK